MTVSASRRRAYGRWIVLGLYALVALVTPLLHHDVTCHLQSKSHCDACTASSLASSIELSGALVGHIGPTQPCAPGNTLAQGSPERPSSPGRAPPVTGFVG